MVKKIELSIFETGIICDGLTLLNGVIKEESSEKYRCKELYKKIDNIFKELEKKDTTKYKIELSIKEC